MTNPEFIKLQEMVNSGKIHKLNSLELRGSVTEFSYTLYKLLPKTVKDFILRKQMEFGRVSNSFSITPNMFGYRKLLSTTGARHFVVWQNANSQKVSTEKVKELVQQWLVSKGNESAQFIIYQNPEYKTSVKNLHHWQLFILKI